MLDDQSRNLSQTCYPPIFDFIGFDSWCGEGRLQCRSSAGKDDGWTWKQISWIETSVYEYKFVCRNLISSVCRQPAHEAPKVLINSVAAWMEALFRGSFIFFFPFSYHKINGLIPRKSLTGGEASSGDSRWTLGWFVFHLFFFFLSFEVQRIWIQCKANFPSS